MKVIVNGKEVEYKTIGEKIDEDIKTVIYIFGGLHNIRNVSAFNGWNYINVRDHNKVKKEYFDLFDFWEDEHANGEIDYKAKNFYAFKELQDFVFDKKNSKEYLKELQQKIHKEMEDK